jgi:hypothetical protein
LDIYGDVRSLSADLRAAGEEEAAEALDDAMIGTTGTEVLINLMDEIRQQLLAQRTEQGLTERMAALYDDVRTVLKRNGIHPAPDRELIVRKKRRR